MRVCIIGAGPSGLCAAKEIKEANPGFQITVLEKARSIGGTFSQSYRGLTMVNNPLLVNFSDFLATEKLPALQMWSAEQYVDYLHRYAQFNAIDGLIEYGVFVKQARWIEGRWRVDVAGDGGERSLEYDYLVVCSGSNSRPNTPTLPGQDAYTGKIVHANELREPADFRGLDVVFVGLGETGSDLSHFVSQHAHSTTVSIRRWPGYLIPRYHDGRPTDLDTSKIHHCLPKNIDESVLGGLLRFKRGRELRHIASGVDKRIQALADRLNTRWPEVGKLGPFRRITTKSCGFLRAHIDGRVQLRPAITRLAGKTAHFEDGSSVAADVIVACTGYQQRFDFLDAEIAARVPSSNALYKYVFPPGSQDRLAFIGFVRPAVGTVPVVAEMQSRMLGLFLAKKLSLPSSERMEQDIADQRAAAQAQFPLDFERIPHLIDYYDLLKKLALEIDVMPRQWDLLFSDAKLWYKVNYSFMCPGIFRLHGPGQKKDQVKDVLKQLPTMPGDILLTESVIYVLCRFLELFGLTQFRTK